MFPFQVGEGAKSPVRQVFNAEIIEQGTSKSPPPFIFLLV